MLVISSREFRDHQKHYFAKAKQGERVIVQQGSKDSFVITPINEGDDYFTPQMIAKIEEALQEYEEGKGTILTREKQKELLGV